MQNGSFQFGNATFTGALGAVVNEECHIGLSMWTPLIERSAYMDFPAGLITMKVRQLKKGTTTNHLSKASFPA